MGDQFGIVTDQSYTYHAGHCERDLVMDTCHLVTQHVRRNGAAMRVQLQCTIILGNSSFIGHDHHRVPPKPVQITYQGSIWHTFLTKFRPQFSRNHLSAVTPFAFNRTDSPTVSGSAGALGPELDGLHPGIRERQHGAPWTGCTCCGATWHLWDGRSISSHLWDGMFMYSLAGLAPVNRHM